MSTGEASYHVVVIGRVQGVGYRASLALVASEHGLRGWVRNRLDGSVEAELHGDEHACASVIAWARRGPPAARVTEVRVAPIGADTTAVPLRFEVRPAV